MTHREHNPNIDPLPPSWDEDLIRLDESVARAIDRDVPADLADRVYMASVRELAASTPEVETAPLRIVGRRDGVSTWMTVGRLALAASVGLVIVVAGMLMNKPPTSAPRVAGGPGTGAGVSDAERIAAPTPREATTAVDAATAFELVLADGSSPVDEYEAELGYLVGTHGLGADQLSSELVTLIAALEVGM